MSDSNLTGKTESELNKTGHYVGNTSNDVKNAWGHSTGHVMGSNGTAQPKPQGQS